MSTTMRISLNQYRTMIDRGEFEPPHHRVELIRGEIVPKDPRGSMSPINPSHDSAVEELNEWSFDVLPRQAVKVRVQGSLGIPGLDSQPEPDLMWLRRRDYSRNHPTPQDVLLLIEVSDSSLKVDRSLKASLYAEAGIQDYWIVNIPARCVEVFREPQGHAYQNMTTQGAGAEVRPMAFPDLALAVARLFPA